MSHQAKARPICTQIRSTILAVSLGAVLGLILPVMLQGQQYDNDRNSSIQTGKPTEAMPSDRSSFGNVIRSVSTQVLVLKTGSVYSGNLEFTGGKYIIRRNNGSAVRFRQGEVDFVTESIELAYLRLFARLDPTDAIGHQRLAHWCLRNKHVVGAKRQLEIMVHLSGISKTSRLLARQIEELQSPNASEIPVQNATASLQPREVRRLPSTNSAMASRAELQKTVDSFSRDSLRDFNRGIHLRIVNGCAASGCHGDPDNAMRIWRVDNRGGINSTGVRRNLHAVSKYLNRSVPEDSPLLRYIGEVHADMDAPPYDPDSHHYHAIRAWVLGTAIQSSVNPEQQADVSQTSFVEPESNGGNVEAIPMIMDDGGHLPRPVDLAGTTRTFRAKDEFDPEIFNRQFGPERPTALIQNRAAESVDGVHEHHQNSQAGWPSKRLAPHSEFQVGNRTKRKSSVPAATIHIPNSGDAPLRPEEHSIKGGTLKAADLLPNSVRNNPPEQKPSPVKGRTRSLPPIDDEG